MPKRMEEVEVDNTVWVIKLENPENAGYFCWSSPDGLTVRKEMGGTVQRFDSKVKAEKVRQSLRKKFKLNIEETKLESFVHDLEIELWLGSGKWPDGLKVEVDEKTKKRFLLIRNDGEEFTTDDFSDWEADALIRVLSKIKDRLKSHRKA